MNSPVAALKGWFAARREGADASASLPVRDRIDVAGARPISDAAVALIKTVEAAAVRLAKKQVHKKPLISSWSALLDYCKANIARAPVEQFRVLLLDRKNRLIDDALMAEGTIDHTPVYPREIARRALELSASSIILVHNHPSGDPTPSRADIDLTREIERALAPLEIRVHDHLVVGAKETISMKAKGLI